MQQPVADAHLTQTFGAKAACADDDHGGGSGQIDARAVAADAGMDGDGAVLDPDLVAAIVLVAQIHRAGRRGNHERQQRGGDRRSREARRAVGREWR